MKTILVTSVVLLTSFFAVSQNSTTRTLFNGNPAKNNNITGYGAASAKLTRFADKPALMTGGYGGVLLNHGFMIGAGAYALTNNVYVPNEKLNNNRVRYDMGYVGLVIEQMIAPHHLIHFTGNVLLGGGYVAKSEAGKKPENLGGNQTWDRSYFYAIEPSLGVEVNTFKWMKVAVGGSYRWISNSETPSITDAQMSAPSGYVTLKFGKF